YTHLQQGQIGTFSHLLLAYAYSLMRDMERLYIAYGRINQSPLGACAIGGTSIKIDRKMTAELLGFDSVVRNSIDATSSRDALIEYVGTLSVLATTLGRVAEDFILWSTSEFGYIELADEQSSTSTCESKIWICNWQPCQDTLYGKRSTLRIQQRPAGP